jgi:hypothetical protein
MSEMTCTLKMLNIADALYAPRDLRMIQRRTRSLTNITTSPDRPHPGGGAVSTGPSDSGLFAVSERPVRFSSQFAAVTTRLCRRGVVLRLTLWSPNDSGTRHRAGFIADRGDQRTMPQCRGFHIEGLVPALARQVRTATSGRKRAQSARSRRTLDTCSRVVQSVLTQVSREATP